MGAPLCFGLYGHAGSLSRAQGAPWSVSFAAAARLEEGKVSSLDQLAEVVVVSQLSEAEGEGRPRPVFGERVLYSGEALLRLRQIEPGDGTDELVPAEADDRLV